MRPLRIFMTGPLGATGAQGAARFIVVGKSPMRQPEGFCYGNLGGYFGSHLKRAGFDGVVICGASEQPVYLLIKDGKAEIRDAGTLWGHGVYTAKERLKAAHGKKVRFVTTGVGGENRCRRSLEEFQVIGQFVASIKGWNEKPGRLP